MRLSTTTRPICHRLGQENTVRMLSDAGFDAFDLSLLGMSCDDDEMNGGDYRQRAARIRRAAEDAGIVCNQSHAPFPTSVGDAVVDAKMYQKILRAIEVASLVGAEVIVVHPRHHLDYNADPDAPARLFEENVAFYTSLVPYCRDFGIRVAMENLWQRDAARHIVDSTCARRAEYVRYLDAVDSEWIVACVDVGHAYLVGEDFPALVGALADRLQALHVHDVQTDIDLHTLPYFGCIPYDEVIKAIAASGYGGDLTFEVDLSLQHVPDDLLPDTLRYFVRVGRQLISRIEAARRAD